MNVSNIFAILAILCIVDSVNAVNWFWKSHQKEGGPSRKMTTLFTVNHLLWNSGWLFLLATVAPSHTWIYWACAIGWTVDILTVRMYHFKRLYVGNKIGTMIISP